MVGPLIGRKNLLLAAVGCALMLVTYCATALADNAVDQVVTAKLRPDAVFIWKTNDAISDLRTRGASAAQIRLELAARATQILVTKSKATPDARKVKVELIYFKSGGMDPNYKVETVAGVDRLGSVGAAQTALAKPSSSSWSKEVLAGKTPAGLSLELDDSAFSNLDAK